MFNISASYRWVEWWKFNKWDLIARFSAPDIMFYAGEFVSCRSTFYIYDIQCNKLESFCIKKGILILKIENSKKCFKVLSNVNCRMCLCVGMMPSQQWRRNGFSSKWTYFEITMTPKRDCSWLTGSFSIAEDKLTWLAHPQSDLFNNKLANSLLQSYFFLNERLDRTKWAMVGRPTINVSLNNVENRLSGWEMRYKSMLELYYR